MKFVILGMGAIGSLWASILYKKNKDIIGICRGKHYEAISSKGLLYKNINGEENTVSVGEHFHIFNNFQSGLKLLNKITKEDWLIITSKAYNLKEIVNDYFDLLRTHGSVLLLQNGIGNEEIIKEKIPEINIFRGTTTMGALLVNPGFVHYTAKGFTKLGYPQINYPDNNKIPKNIVEKLTELIEILNSSGISTEYSQNIDVILWEKIFINTGIDAPAAIRGIPNGELVQSSEIMNQMRNAITEAWKVGKAMGIELDNLPDRYIELAYDVARKTAHNKNSMLQDLMQQKPTEIDFINGKILDYSHNVGINVPENEKLTKSIKLLEQKTQKS